MNKMRWTVVALLTLFCLAFCRTETTERSMVRAIILEKEETGWIAGLLYQAPEASADSSEASAEIRFASAYGQSIEQALAASKAMLPYTANFRLCDYLLLPPGNDIATLQEYEELVLKRQYGRTAAMISGCSFSCEELSEESKENDRLFAELLQALKNCKELSPKMYEMHQSSGILLPEIELDDGCITCADDGIFLTSGGTVRWDMEKAEIYRLLSGKKGTRKFEYNGRMVELEDCLLSIAPEGDGFAVRFDCRLAKAEIDQGTEQWLEALCTDAAIQLWNEGIDALGLHAYAALWRGTSAAPNAKKNACPQLRTDVHISELL